MSGPVLISCIVNVSKVHAGAEKHELGLNICCKCKGKGLEDPEAQDHLALGAFSLWKWKSLGRANPKRLCSKCWLLGAEPGEVQRGACTPPETPSGYGFASFCTFSIILNGFFQQNLLEAWGWALVQVTAAVLLNLFLLITHQRVKK